MKLSPSFHELISIICLGLATLTVMMGYDTQAFIVESVLHSVNYRDSDRIDAHAGYYGQSVLYGCYTVFNLLAPWICFRVGSKWTLFAGSILFTLYLVGFFFLNSVYYYISQALLGVGFALYYVGQGMYMSEHSSRETISRNSVLITAIGNSSMLVGGLVLALLFTLNGSSFSGGGVGENSTTLEHPGSGSAFRDFPDAEIYLIYGVLLLSSLASNVIFAALPVKQFDSLAQMEPVVKQTFQGQLGLMWSTVTDTRVLLLSPFFLFYGLHIAYWLTAYPTTFAFASSLASNPLLPAYYSAMVGVGNIVVGSYIHVMSSWDPSFGLVPTMATQSVLSLVVYTLSLLTTPNHATIYPTDELAMWIQPTTTICLLTGLLHGMIDCCSCTMRSVICTIVIPERRLQAYSVAKLFQSLATCAGSFLGPQLTVTSWIMLLAGLQLLSATGFCIVSKRVQSEEMRKIHDLAASFPNVLMVSVNVDLSVVYVTITIACFCLFYHINIRLIPLMHTSTVLIWTLKH